MNIWYGHCQAFASFNAPDSRKVAKDAKSRVSHGRDRARYMFQTLCFRMCAYFRELPFVAAVALRLVLRSPLLTPPPLLCKRFHASALRIHSGAAVMVGTVSSGSTRKRARRLPEIRGGFNGLTVVGPER